MKLMREFKQNAALRYVTLRYAKYSNLSVPVNEC